VVADPLHLLDICATSDGAAAVVLASTEYARRHGLVDPVRVKAISTVTPTFPNTVIDMPLMSTDPAGPVGEPERTFKESIGHAAYEEAGIGPEDVDVAEVYDLSTALELDWIEDLALCKRGEAEQLLRAGDTTIGGRIPVNPSGGLAAARPGRGPSGRGRPRRDHRQPGPLRPRVLGDPRPVTAMPGSHRRDAAEFVSLCHSWDATIGAPR
jgi:acetyl-CoA acetyltransferase